MPRTPGQAADRVAEEVSARIERLSTLAAEAILHSLYAPQVVAPPRAQALEYWHPFFFTPDGLVDQAGRDRVVKMVGGPEYKRIAQDLAAQLRKDQREAEQDTPVLEPTPPATPPLAPTPDETPASGGSQLPPLYGPRTQPLAA